MITFPCAKINLGLNIVAERPDGYHDIETVFYPVPLTDALEIKYMSDEFPSDVPCDLKITGRVVDCDEQKNLDDKPEDVPVVPQVHVIRPAVNAILEQCDFGRVIVHINGLPWLCRNEPVHCCGEAFRHLLPNSRHNKTRTHQGSPAHKYEG